MRKAVYVAGASSERHERVKPVMEALRRAGFIITHDWTEAVDMHGANNEHGTLSLEELQECAYLDIAGVKTADALVLLAPKKASTGAWVELGIALEQRIPVYIAGACDHCIFTFLPRCTKFATDSQLVEALVKEGV